MSEEQIITDQEMPDRPRDEAGRFLPYGKWIVSRQENDIVAITCPAPYFMKAVTHGGFGRIPGVDGQKAEDKQVDNMVRSGYDEDFSSRFVRALIVGGETDAGGLELIKDRHLAEQADHAVVGWDDLPTDRWFRNAWRLSDNGIVYVDMEVARLLFAQKLLGRKAEEVKQLVADIETAILTGKSNDQAEAAHVALKNIDMHALAAEMAKAETPEALRALWPEHLPEEPR